MNLVVCRDLLNRLDLFHRLKRNPRFEFGAVGSSLSAHWGHVACR